MHVFTAVLLVAVSAYAIARPPGPTDGPAALSKRIPNVQDFRAMILPLDQIKNDLPLNARYTLPQYIGFQEASPRLSLPPRNLNIDWLSKEIEKINEMVDEAEALRPYLNTPFKQSWSSDQWTPHFNDYPQEGSNELSISYTNYGHNDDGNQLLSNTFINEPLDSMPVKKTSDFTETTNKPEESVITPKNEKTRTDHNPEVDHNNPTDNSQTTKTTIFDNSRQLERSIGIPTENRKMIEQSLRQKEPHTTIRFALIPTDKEYFEHLDEELQQPKVAVPRDPLGKKIHHEGGDGGHHYSMLIDQRPIRQNPNLSKQKHLLEPDLGKLKSGLANKDYRMPVSLLPTNLRWLKVKQEPEVIRNRDDNDSSLENEHGYHMGSSGPRPVLVSEAAEEDSVYGIALISAVGAALAMASVGVLFGWYSLARKAKMAADVDYPAYGVTGPSIDNSGDRKLAQSAHMYHYQHQKQQIIAMERNGLEQRTGSISDNDSEEENEEGDYTVYECPGFATTGEMEVKNPLFSEDPTPSTPGKCQVVKPQPKN